MATNYSPKVVTDGLVLYLDAANGRSYPGSGTTWYDLSGNGNHGEMENGLFFDSGAKKMTFDGSNDRVVCGTWSLDYLTISVWLYRTAAGSNRGICRKNFSWALSLYQGYLQVAPGVSWRFYNTNYALPMNTWTHVSYTYSGTGTAGSQSVYVNGSRIFENSVGSTALPSNSNPVRVGFDDNSWWWVGDIPKIKIYGRALSGEEVYKDFNATRSRFGI